MTASAVMVVVVVFWKGSVFVEALLSLLPAKLPLTVSCKEPVTC